MTNEEHPYLNMAELEKVVGMARQTITKLMKAGEFPKSFCFTGNKGQKWVKTEIDEWIKNQIEMRRYKP